MPRLIEVIESETTRGSGRSESDPIRIVRQYHALDGELLAEHDPFEIRIAKTAESVDPFSRVGK